MGAMDMGKRQLVQPGFAKGRAVAAKGKAAIQIQRPCHRGKAIGDRRARQVSQQGVITDGIAGRQQAVRLIQKADAFGRMAGQVQDGEDAGAWGNAVAFGEGAVRVLVRGLVLVRVPVRVPVRGLVRVPVKVPVRVPVRGRATGPSLAGENPGVGVRSGLVRAVAGKALFEGEVPGHGGETRSLGRKPEAYFICVQNRRYGQYGRRLRRRRRPVAATRLGRRGLKPQPKSNCRSATSPDTVRRLARHKSDAKGRVTSVTPGATVAWVNQSGTDRFCEKRPERSPGRVGCAGQRDQAGQKPDLICSNSVTMRSRLVGSIGVWARRVVVTVSTSAAFSKAGSIMPIETAFAEA